MKKSIIIFLSLLYAVAFANNGHTLNQSVIVLNQTTNSIDYIQNGSKISSIASITKLMTAMIVLDNISNLETKMYSSRFYLGRKEFTVNELLKLLLIRSDNYAAEILSRNTLKSREEFIASMNTKAKQIGMSSALFADPSGLDSNNKATAQDIATMVSVANLYPYIQQISSKKYLSIKTYTKKGQTILQKKNTNFDILTEFNNITLSKTGTTNAAGKCVVLSVVKNNQTFIIVILGEASSAKRNQRVRKLMKELI